MAENKVRFLRGTAAEYANAVKDDDTFYYTTDDEKFYVGSKEITGGGITVDSELSDTSTNPVYNKVIKAAIDEKADKTVATTTADGLMSAADKTKLDEVDDKYALKSEIPTSLPANGGNADTLDGKHADAFLQLSDDITLNNVNIKKSTHAVSDVDGYWSIWTDDEGGNLEIKSPDGNHSIQMDLFNNETFRMYFDDGTGLVFPANYDFATKKFNINGDSHTVNSHTVDSDVPANAVFTDTTYAVVSASADGLMSAEDKVKLDGVDDKCALKSKYGDTTIDVGRKADTTVGINSTAEGYNTTASGLASHAEGYNTTASGLASHAEGCDTTASGSSSHAGGTGTKALHFNEVAYGKYNESNDDTLFSIGDGTTDANRHNAFEITKTGGMLHDKDILTSAHCIQFIPCNLKYYALNDRILLFSNDDDLARGIYFVNNTPNEITVCALISATGTGPVVQYGYGSNTYPEIQNTGDGREWFSEESIPTSPTIFAMTVPSGKLGYYGLYSNSEAAYTTIHDIRCPYFNFF